VDVKHLQALSRGREYMLARIANLPIPFQRKGPRELALPVDGDEARATEAVEAFRAEFGDLYPGMEVFQYWSYIFNFRHHWKWRSLRASLLPKEARSRRGKRTGMSVERHLGAETNQSELNDVNAWCTNIWNRRGEEDLSRPPAIEVDFASGHLRIIPETLLDWLILHFMECRRNLAICAREHCETPYFVKIHARTKYCSPSCFHLHRAAQQARWEQENRGNRGRKRRKHLARETRSSRKKRIVRGAQTKKLHRQKSR
jgi:hypothetical protein